MAEAGDKAGAGAPARGGMRGRGGPPPRGGARPGGRPGGRGGRGGEEGAWVPVTKLGRLVHDRKIKKIEEIFLHSLPVKEYQILDQFFGDALKDEVVKIMPVQKQTMAGQRTRFKATVCVGDSNGHVGLGTKCSKEVATAIRGAIILAKLALVPVRRGFWGSKIGKPHTIPGKVSGKAGSVNVRLVPAPRGSGLVAAPTSKKVLKLAGISDVYTAAQGRTKTQGNFALATFHALVKTYAFLTPDLWRETKLPNIPYGEFSEFLQKKH